MYLRYFNMNEFPFMQTPNTRFYYELSSAHEALNVLLFSIQTGEAFVKIVGEVGSGKTLLCRNLLHQLDHDYISAYIPNPDLSVFALRKVIANELGILVQPHMDQHIVMQLITDKLMEYHAQGKKVILVIDEAQVLPEENLETLRLMTNLETESAKLLQIVLLGQPELDQRLNQHKLRQLKQRITFSYYLKPLHRTELASYLCHRLATAGYMHGNLFTTGAQKLLYRYSRGIPRLINILAHKAMLIAYGKGKKQVDIKAMYIAAKDCCYFTAEQRWTRNQKMLAATLLMVGIITIAVYLNYLGWIHW